MATTKILTLPGAVATKADLGVRVEAGTVLLPEDLSRAMERLALRNVEELMAAVVSFPSALARELGWDAGEVRGAAAGLSDRLQGVVDPGLLRADWAEAPPTGARNPWSVAEPDRRRDR